MKKILFLLLVVGGFSSCKCKKAVAENSALNKTVFATNCPADAKCIVHISKDTAVVVKRDGIGKLYFVKEQKPGITTYHYTMSENQDEQYMDGGYREEIVFQLPSDFKDGTISGKQILETNALFGVFCYCKEKAGYYTIESGSISKTGSMIKVEISALVEGQKVHFISFEVK